MDTETVMTNETATLHGGTVKVDAAVAQMDRGGYRNATVNLAMGGYNYQLEVTDSYASLRIGNATSDDVFETLVLQKVLAHIDGNFCLSYELAAESKDYVADTLEPLAEPLPGKHRLIKSVLRSEWGGTEEVATTTYHYDDENRVQISVETVEPDEPFFGKYRLNLHRRAYNEKNQIIETAWYELEDPNSETYPFAELMVECGIRMKNLFDAEGNLQIPGFRLLDKTTYTYSNDPEPEWMGNSQP